MRGEGETQEAQGAEGQAGYDAAPFAEATDEGTDERAGDDARADADDSKGQADVAFGPSVSILGVDDEDGGGGLLGGVEERHNGGGGGKVPVRTQGGQGNQPSGRVPRWFGEAP